MYKFATVLQAGFLACHIACAESLPSSFPTVIPGPGMPSLASIGQTSASLYREAYTMLYQPHRGMSYAPQDWGNVFQRSLPLRCLGIATAVLPDALSLAFYLNALGGEDCGVHRSDGARKWVSAGSAKVVGMNVDTTRDIARSNCSDVATALMQILDGCMFGAGSVAEASVGGHILTGSDRTLGVFLSSKHQECCDWSPDLYH